MRIRNVKREDMREFIDVYMKSYENLEEYAYNKRNEVKRYFKWLLYRDSNGFFVYEVGNSAVGFIACDANWFSYFENCVVGEIHEIFVLPEMRGRGIGKAMLLRGLAYFEERDLSIAELWVGITNYDAQSFYLKMQFERAEIVGKWMRMRKILNAARGQHRLKLNDAVRQ
ncbi:MAG: GNAT family N-acetyltransferase [Canidatus Methanoxibalbensis ujae]|nr:GNAT family N-acetyltransferase [Candidatus Methanoxibalbensis ujae]